MSLQLPRIDSSYVALNGNSYPQLLNVDHMAEELGFNVHGKADVLITYREAAAGLQQVGLYCPMRLALTTNDISAPHE